jgi:Sec-independent protein secretion pathway component TatC
MTIKQKMRKICVLAALLVCGLVIAGNLWVLFKNQSFEPFKTDYKSIIWYGVFVAVPMFAIGIWATIKLTRREKGLSLACLWISIFVFCF